MRFTVLNWNIGGAKFLETKDREERKERKKLINDALCTLVSNLGKPDRPDVITLQEIVRYREPADNLSPNEYNEIIDKIPEGYTYHPFVLIDTKQVSSKVKWEKVLKDSDWDENAYFAQGNAFLVKKNAPVFPVWDLSNLEQVSSFSNDSHYVEHVHLESGLYFGDRNTEPRAALVMHFILHDEDSNSNTPVDIFVVNVHLATLTKEREGVPAVDAQAVQTRLSQLDIIFNGIVSRYNSWRIDSYPSRKEPHVLLETEATKRHSPVWILSGDFNFTEESEEYQYINRRNFIDTVEEKRGQLDGEEVKGTKAAGVNKPPTLTLDYVFAGPKFVSLDPMLEKVGVRGSKVIYEKYLKNTSDHYPVLSTIDFQPRGNTN